MCLAFLSDHYTTLTLLGETVFLSLKPKKDGEIGIRAREIYDVFFRPDHDWKGGRLVCISPHKLVYEKRLAVMATHIGAGGDDDTMYPMPMGLGPGVVYDTNTNTVEAKIIGGDDQANPTVERFIAEFLQPTVQEIPRLSGHCARRVMAEAGTAFEVLLGNLKANRSYVFRLVVEPELIGQKNAKNTNNVLEEFKVDYEASASICSPKECHFQYQYVLRNLKQKEPEEATAILQEVANADLRLARVELQRVVVILPRECHFHDVQPDGHVSSPGNILNLKLADGNNRSAMEWRGGFKIHPNDDPESLGRRIYSYLKDWSQRGPKNKEQIAVGVGNVLQNENCNLLVTTLAKAGALVCVDENQGLYTAVLELTEPLDNILKVVADSLEVRKDFQVGSYEIKFSLKFQDLTDKKIHRRVHLKHFKEGAGFWIVLALAVFGAVGVLAPPWLTMKLVFPLVAIITFLTIKALFHK